MPLFYAHPEIWDAWRDQLQLISAGLETMPESAGKNLMAAHLRSFSELDRSRSTRMTHGDYEPRNRYECLTRHVPPEIFPGNPDLHANTTGPTSRNSTDLCDLAAKLPPMQDSQVGLSVRLDPDIIFLLRDHLDSTIPPPVAFPELDQASLAFLRRWVTMLDGTVDAMRQAELHYEAEQMGAARLYLAELVSVYNNDPVNLRNSPPPDRVPQWVIREPKKAKMLTDWICKFNDHIIALFEGKRPTALPTDLLVEATAHLLTRRGQRFRMHLVNTGSTAAERSWKILTDTNTLNDPRYKPLLLSLLQNWLQHHNYGVRWGMLSNFETAIATHLSHAYSLSISPPILRTAGNTEDNLTLIACMVALAWSPPHPPEVATDSETFAPLQSFIAENRSRPRGGPTAGSPHTANNAAAGPSGSLEGPTAPAQPGSGPTMLHRALDPRLQSPMPHEQRSTTDRAPSLIRRQGPPTAVEKAADMRKQLGIRTTELEPLHDVFRSRPAQARLGDQGFTFSSTDAATESLLPNPSPIEAIATERIARGQLWSVYKGTLWLNPPGTKRARPGSGPVARPRNASDGSTGTAASDLSDGQLPDAESETGSLSSTESTTAALPVVIKVTSPSWYEFVDWEDNKTPEEAVNSVYKELAVLDRLQRNGAAFLPTLRGAWRIQVEDRSLFVVIMDLCGGPLARTWAEVRTSDRPEIIAMYKQLHAAGVVHNDVQPRHLRYRFDPSETPDRRPGRSKFVLIDFDNALLDPSPGDVHSERLGLASAMQASMDLWSLGGSSPRANLQRVGR